MQVIVFTAAFRARSIPKRENSVFPRLAEERVFANGTEASGEAINLFIEIYF
jgi:hypothetical protein